VAGREDVAGVQAYTRARMAAEHVEVRLEFADVGA
jgi:hypothetical protein